MDITDGEGVAQLSQGSEEGSQGKGRLLQPTIKASFSGSVVAGNSADLVPKSKPKEEWIEKLKPYFDYSKKESNKIIMVCKLKPDESDDKGHKITDHQTTIQCKDNSSFVRHLLVFLLTLNICTLANVNIFITEISQRAT